MFLTKNLATIFVRSKHESKSCLFFSLISPHPTFDFTLSYIHSITRYFFPPYVKLCFFFFKPPQLFSFFPSQTLLLHAPVFFHTQTLLSPFPNSYFLPTISSFPLYIIIPISKISSKFAPLPSEPARDADGLFNQIALIFNPQRHS